LHLVDSSVLLYLIDDARSNKIQVRNVINNARVKCVWSGKTPSLSRYVFASVLGFTRFAAPHWRSLQLAVPYLAEGLSGSGTNRNCAVHVYYRACLHFISLRTIQILIT